MFLVVSKNYKGVFHIKKNIKRKKRGSKLLRTAGTALGVAAVAAATTYATTYHMVKLAAHRSVPKFIENAKKQVSGSRKDISAMLEEAEAGAKALESAQTELVEISADDGATLIGHWYPAEKPKRIIIAMHGWRSSWSFDFGLAAELWHNDGCSVLFAEQRGQNNSGGDYMGFGLIERYDCRSWIKWVIENHNKGEKLPIYLSGISMGATSVLMAAGLDLPSCVHGITADCGFTSLHEIWDHVVSRNLHLPYKLYGFMAEDMFRRMANIEDSDYSTLDALKYSKIPVLFIHGTDDSFVPIKMTYENYKACTAPKRLLIVPGAEHGLSFLVEKEKYIQTVRDFWREFD